MKKLESAGGKLISFFEDFKVKGKIRYSLYFATMHFFILIMILMLIPIDENSAPEKRNHVFYYVVILGPIVETLLFQALLSVLHVD
ncbi:hypothetical protein ACO0LF_22110 [Undibacterium sp. Di27W]|uniref:hypothetical protein n=1 Tax=Undibacterium sp. Di27W TaxID=3413036 RepID=UPI003BF229E2